MNQFTPIPPDKHHRDLLDHLLFDIEMKVRDKLIPFTDSFHLAISCCCEPEADRAQQRWMWRIIDRLDPDSIPNDFREAIEYFTNNVKR